MQKNDALAASSRAVNLLYGMNSGASGIELAEFATSAAAGLIEPTGAGIASVFATILGNAGSSRQREEMQLLLTALTLVIGEVKSMRQPQEELLTRLAKVEDGVRRVIANELSIEKDGRPFAAAVRFRTDGTVGIHQSNNVTAITDHGTNEFTVHFSSVFEYSPQLLADRQIDFRLERMPSACRIIFPAEIPDEVTLLAIRIG